MDNVFSKSRIGIGYSSNLAQLAMTYYWTELQSENPDPQRLEELSDNFVILSVLAQIVIDSCKRLYEIDGIKEIDRISKLPCMTMKKEFVDKNGNKKMRKCDFPEFMRYTREISVTKNGKELPQEDIEEEKDKLRGRINHELICPMNWLQEWLDKIQGASKTTTTPTEKFFIKMKGTANNRQMTKIVDLVGKYDSFTRSISQLNKGTPEYYTQLKDKSDEILQELSSIKIGNIVTINRLVELSLGFSKEIGNSFKREYSPEKYTRKILNLLYKMNKEKFLLNFVPEQEEKFT